MWYIPTIHIVDIGYGRDRYIVDRHSGSNVSSRPR